MHCDFDLAGMPLGQVHDTTLHFGQQLCEILFKSKKAVRSFS